MYEMKFLEQIFFVSN